ncbi:MAG: hypothetical protein J6Z49_06300 [Kiritimatiellae bacterium]|nr:hypothetical protein [Kiritimatiellia bacterium]
MALDINGYNSVFKFFVDFAQKRVDAHDAKAVIDAHVNRLDGRKILAITKSETDEVHKWLRTTDEHAVNDRTRDLFKKAIINMFGGEAKIPESVKKAMLLGDYNCGKPLTARRIMAVKAAIDADGTAKARAEKIRLETFSPEVKTAVLEMGYTKAELPRLARATHFYAQAMGVSEMDAMREVCEPGTKANRLMSYGGRFMENAANFADGLRLLDLFAAWHGDLCEATAAIKATGVFEDRRDYSSADTPSKLNADTASVKPAARNVMEKFAFEELAHNPAANLKETSGEAIFGFKNNLASRFVGQDFGHSCLNTVGNIPPAKRALVFKTLNLFCSLAETSDDHKKPAHDRYIIMGGRTRTIARILRHFDEIAALDAKGKLTAKNVIKTCFPDLVEAKATGNWDAKAINKFFDDLNTELYRDPDAGGKYSDIAMPIEQLMESTGCTLKEAAESLNSGKPIPQAPYISAGQLEITEFDTVAGGRSTMEGDLCRPENYSLGKGAPGLLGPDAGFGFTFPGENRFITNGSAEGRANIQRVGDKVQEMCGRIHPKQAASVMMMLSQSGLARINKGLRPYGVESTEHAAVDYTLSRNDVTGAVTIKYTSPAELPFRFEWTATVDVDGKVTTTPMKFEKPVEMNAKVAAKSVADAAKAMGLNLTRAQTAKAVALVQEFGTDMYAKNLAIFAKFVVNCKLTDQDAASDRLHAEDIAGSIRKWKDFGYNEPGMEPFLNAIKDYANNDLAVARGRPNKFVENDPGIYAQILKDANRIDYTINGVPIASKESEAVAKVKLVAAIKAALPELKAQKVATILMNQESIWHLKFPRMHTAYGAAQGQEEGVEAFNLPGADKISNNKYGLGIYNVSIDGQGGMMGFSLDVAPDSRTATITLSYTDQPLLSGYGSKFQRPIATATITEKLTIDLTAEDPIITDVRLSQTLA